MPSITCTNCSAVLKTKDPVPPGKKVKCPKCNQPFVVPEEEPADEPEPEEKEAAADGDDGDEEEAAPAKKGKAASKSADDEDADEGDDDDKAKKKGKGDGKPKSKTGLIIGIVAGVLLLCCCLPGCVSGIIQLTMPELFTGKPTTPTTKKDEKPTAKTAK